MLKDDDAERPRISRAMICAVAGAGSFLIAGSATLATYGASELKAIPLSVQSDTVSLAPDAAVLDTTSTLRPGPIVTDTGVDLTINTYVTTEDPVSEEITTLQAAQQTFRTDNGPESGLVSASIDRVTLDRRSGYPLGDPVATTQTEADAPAVHTPRQGLQYKFPFDVQKRSYPYYDGTARATKPIDFVDDDRVINGLTLFHFTQTISPTDLGASIGDAATLTLPASKWGLPGDIPTTMNLHYENTRHIWVEPTSGSIVLVEEHPHRWLQRSEGDAKPVTTLDARTTFSDDTVSRLADQAATAKRSILWGTRYGPLGGGVAGVVLLLAGLFLGVLARKLDKTR